MTTSALKFENLSGGYGDTQILFDVSGEVRTGEILGVFGRNGVGKTTLSRLLSGSLLATTGSVTLNEKQVTTGDTYMRRLAGLSYMPQTSMVFDNLTVQENLSLAKSTRCPNALLDHFPRLRERQNQIAGSMSGGERKILAFVRTMLEETNVIILDEPSEGVQPENIQRMETCIANRRDEGHAIILVEQNLNMLMKLGDQFLGLESGRSVFLKNKGDTHRNELLDVLMV